MMNIEPYKTTLNQANAYWMARLAKVIYISLSTNNAPDEEKILGDIGAEDPKFRSIKGASRSSAQGALIEHAEYFAFVFRGTDEGSDWLDNLRVFPERVLFGKFHRGFWESVQDIWEPLFERYQRLRQVKKRPVFFTGHSLGGAMATVAAARFIHQDLPFTSVYTFGQPRAMTRETARTFNTEAKNRFFRFQNNNDIVTRVPARLMGYSHVGSVVYISEEKRLHTDPGWWFRFLDAIDGALEAVRERGLDAIEDHGMENYLEAIQEWNYVSGE